eukprot:TRINITY_DN2250_c0_g1_i1.p1 TRINITY_DN2250_c0_g1~~TRINITY_DN2250_c0_g1_i1.p1  ORF type:complete len:297 (-),score=18.74 TRINITY_DN2250_c0_g1_i1:175-1065(-)
MSATSMEELPEPHAEVKAKWIKLQLDLKKKLVQKDSFEWKVPSGDGDSDLRLIGGVDISFVKGNPVDACACLVVVSYPDLEVVYTACEMVQLTEPYISTFLAFREAPFLVDLVSELRKKSPELVPQLILVDGNGVLHPRGFGLASHLGVLCGIPTIGVGKSFLFVDGVTDKSIRTLCKQKCHAKGDYVFIVGQSGTTHGAVRTHVESTHAKVTQAPHPLALHSLTHAAPLTRIAPNHHLYHRITTCTTTPGHSNDCVQRSHGVTRRLQANLYQHRTWHLLRQRRSCCESYRQVQDS